MAKAFLSHSSANKDLVEKIAASLGTNKCHYDRFTFEVGNKTLDEILHALDSTDIFVLFLSNEALESPWVKKEITQANINLNNGIISKVFPVIIDPSINYKDERIPSWIRKPYNLQHLDNEVLILKKIRQLIRLAEFKQHKHLEELNDLFVGRNDLMQEFETKFITIDDCTPTCVIAYNYIQGTGRRTFMKNALKKVNIVGNYFDPLIIPIEAKESIEDFIYKLNLIDPKKRVLEQDFSELSIGEKLQLAREVVLKFSENNEILFIEDHGSIILPNNSIADWFEELIDFEEFKNKVCFCIISKFRPSVFALSKNSNIVGFRVDELSRPDTQNLFLRYLKIMRIDISKEDKEYFINHLSGIPAQTIYAANLIASSSAIHAKSLIKDIESYNDQIALSILDYFGKDDHTLQVLIVLSKVEIISYEFITKLFTNEEELTRSLQSLFDLSTFNFMFSGYEYLKLNTAISDYIKRARISLNPEYSEKFNQLILDSLTDVDLDEKLEDDYSEFLFALQNRLVNGKEIPKKFFIPSYVLKTIVQKYYDTDYDVVIKLCEKLLENPSNYDSQIIRETKYWLCQAYAKKSNEKFFQEVKFFKQAHKKDNKDYYFLLGFYHRCDRNYDKATEYYQEVLSIDDSHSRAKRELVIVYTAQGEFPKALGLARDNYDRFPSNVYHAQAYFTCLIKKNGLTDEESDEIEEILEMVCKSPSQKSREMYAIMEAEYQYYRNNDLARAISMLQEALRVHSKKVFAYRSLKEIYRRRDMIEALNKLRNDFEFDVDIETTEL